MTGKIFAERKPAGGGSVFHDMDAESYPFVAVFLDADTGEEVWRAVVREPGATSVPSMPYTERPTTTRIYFYSGRIFDMGPEKQPVVHDLTGDPMRLQICRDFIDSALQMEAS